MLNKVIGLRGTAARVRVGKVVSSSDETSFGGAIVVGGEAGVRVCCAFGRFDDDELGALGGLALHVDSALVMADVEARDAIRGTLVEGSGRYEAGNACQGSKSVRKSDHDDWCVEIRDGEYGPG